MEILRASLDKNILARLAVGHSRMLGKNIRLIASAAEIGQHAQDEGIVDKSGGGKFCVDFIFFRILLAHRLLSGFDCF